MFKLVLAALFGDRRRGRKVREFTRQFSMLLKAGLREAEALSAIVSEMPYGFFKKVLLDILKRMEQGAAFSSALYAHPMYFHGSYVSMVSAGEKSGSLAETMTSLVDFARRPGLAGDKVFLAILVPARLLVYLVPVVAFLTYYVVPKMSVVLGNFSDESFRTASSASPSAPWLWSNLRFLPLVAVLGTLGILLVFDITYHRPAQKSLLLARFATSLRVMIKANLPLEEIENATGDLSWSLRYRAAMRRLFPALQAGTSFTDAFRAVRYFPDTFQWLMATGEAQGNLQDPLRDLAGIYSLRGDAKLSVIVNVMPPLIMIWLGIVIGVLGYSFFALVTGLIQSLL